MVSFLFINLVMHCHRLALRNCIFSTLRGGGDGRDGYRYILNWMGDNIANITLGADHNDALAYAPVL